MGPVERISATAAVLLLAACARQGLRTPAASAAAADPVARRLDGALPEGRPELGEWAGNRDAFAQVCGAPVEAPVPPPGRTADLFLGN